MSVVDDACRHWAILAESKYSQSESTFRLLWRCGTRASFLKVTRRSYGIAFSFDSGFQGPRPLEGFAKVEHRCLKQMLRLCAICSKAFVSFLTLFLDWLRQKVISNLFCLPLVIWGFIEEAVGSICIFICLSPSDPKSRTSNRRGGGALCGSVCLERLRMYVETPKFVVPFESSKS